MDEDEWRERREWDDLGWSDQSEDAARSAAQEYPTPGERLLYALGQLYRRSRAGELDVDPNDYDIENVARIIGVWREVEFVQTDYAGVAYHFPSEVLCVDPGRAFPWRLKGVWEWAVRQEFRLENDDFD